MATVETPSDLKLLPLRALVAYAARCARRVQPLYAIPEEHPEAQSSAAAIDEAIRFAEHFAAGRNVKVDQLKTSEQAIVRALMVANEDDVCDEAAAYAANAAYAVVDATRAALLTIDADDPVAAARKVVDSATIATDAAKAADTSVQRAARLDWEMLHRMHLGRFPEFGEPIDPGEDGMLGPLFCGQPRIERKVAPAPRIAPKSRRRTEAGDDSDSNSSRRVGKVSKSKKSAAPAGSKKVQQWVEKLQSQQEQLKSEKSAFRAERALFHSELNAFQLERDELLAEQASIEAARAELVRQSEELAELQAQFERERQALEEREVKLREQAADAVDQPEELREHIAHLRAALQSSEEERNRLRDEIEQSRDRQPGGGDVDELRSQIARLRSQTERLEAERETLRGETEELRQRAVELEQQLADTAANGEANPTSDGETAAELARLRSENGRLTGERDKFQKDVEEFRAKQAAFRTEMATFEAERQRFQADSLGASAKLTKLQQERKELEALQAELEDTEERLNRDREDVEQSRAELRREQSEFAEQRQSFEAERGEYEEARARLRDEQEALEALSEETAAARQGAAESRNQVDEERQRLDALKTELDVHRAEFEAARLTFEEERAAFQEQADLLETERCGLLEEKSRFAQREAELLKTIRELKKKRGSKSTAAECTADDPQAAQLEAKVSELEQQLANLREDRDRLERERNQLSKELRQLRSAKGKAASPPSNPKEIPNLEEAGPRGAVAAPEPELSAPPLRLLIQRGSAGAGEIAALFSEVARLYQRLGGDGLCFKISDCRVRRRTSDPRRKGGSSDERSFVEILLRPTAPKKESHIEFNAGQWDQFRSCLCMIMRLDAGLAEGFQNGDPAAGSHPAHKLIADAITRAYAADAAERRAAEEDGSSLRIDSVNQQLHRVEQMLRTLERQRMLGIELTPIVELETERHDAESAPSAVSRPWRRRLLRLLILVTAALALASGIRFWSELCQYLGVSSVPKSAWTAPAIPTESTPAPGRHAISSTFRLDVPPLPRARSASKGSC